MSTKKDVIAEVLGDFGRWQFRSVFLIYLCKIPSAWFMACLIFTAPTPKPGEFYCKPATGDGGGQEIAQNKLDWTRDIQSNDITIDYCNAYDDINQRYENFKNSTSLLFSSNRTAIPCESFVHDQSYPSTVTQFDLVCSRSVLIAVAQFFHLFGVLVGGFMATKLIEICSPRKMMLIGMITQVIFGCITGITSSYEIHMFFRFLAAVACAHMYTPGQLIFSDITAGKYKMISTCLYENFWSIGLILLSILAYLSVSWIHLYFYISLPTIAYMVLWIWIPDSPRWLLRKGYIDKVNDLLIQAAKFNGREYLVPNDLLARLKTQSTIKTSLQQPTWFSLWIGPKAAVNMILIHVGWAAFVNIYNGMTLNVKAFGKDFVYFNLVILAISEIVGVYIGLLLILKCKRKWLWTGLFNIFAGLFASAGFFFYSSSLLTEIDKNYLLMLTALITKAAVSCSQAILFSCSVEIVPAEKRPILMLSCVIFARIWLLTAPFLGMLTVFHQLLGLSVFGAIGIVGGLTNVFIKTNKTIEKSVRENRAILKSYTIPSIYFIERKL